MDSIEKLSAEEVEDLEDSVSVPYRVEDVTVLSEGEWNGLQWTGSELRRAVEETDFSMEQERGDKKPPNASLFYDHDDRSADQFIGQVENVRMEGDDVVTDLVISDKQAAMNLEFGAPFGVSPKADGMVDESGKMQNFKFENFSMVVNPAVKTTWLNEDISTVLQDMEVHRPKFQSTDERDWNSPNLEDFTDKSWSDMNESEKNAVGRHFLISKSGFPAENYGDLALPVVEPDGTLNLNALQNAKARVGQVSGIDEDEIRRVSKMINNLANGNFEDADFAEVDMAENGELSEDMPVGEDDWVQWNPEEGVEAHGKVVRVIEPDSEDESLKVDVRMYVQDDEGVWHPTGDVRRKDMDEVGPWGNTPTEDAISDERLEDVANASPVRKFDPDEDADDVSESIKKAVENGEFEELISDSQEKAIEDKVEEHNEKHGDEEGKKVTKTMLKKVYERGLAAHEDTHRPGMSPQQWSMARVNAFLYLVRNGNPENDNYTQDNDLLPDGHPKAGETESSENDVMVNNQMAENEEQEPDADEASAQEEESAEDFVTAEELEDFKSEVVDSLKQELGDEDEEVEDEGDEVEEAEASDKELSEFEEFRKENPDMSLSEAAEEFEESNKDVEEKIDEVTEMFESKISDLEEKLEEKNEEVEELSEKVSNPQRATQVSGEEEGGESLDEKVSELSDEELHAQIFQQMSSDRGVSATKEMIHND